MYIDLTKNLQVDAVKQIPGDRACLGYSVSMAMKTSIDEFKKFLITISPEYKNINSEAPWGLMEAKLYCLKFDKDIIATKNDLYNKLGPTILVVKSEHFKNVLHAIYLSEIGFINDPNPDTKDGRDISTYKVVERYNIVLLNND